MIFRLFRQLRIWRTGCCLLAATGFAPDLPAQLPGIAFSRYTTDDGLPHDNVSNVVQDREGFLWVGTNDGLARFDGRHFEVFRHADSLPYSIPHNQIMSLSVDPQGRLWVTTAKGSCRRDPVSGTFHPVLLQPPGKTEPYAGYINGLVVDREGYGWLATEEFLARLDLNTLETTYFPCPEAFRSVMSGLYEDSRHRYWINMSGRIVRFYPQTGHFEYYMGLDDGRPPASMIAEGPDGRIWVSTWGHGFYVLNEDTGRFEDFPDEKAVSLLFLFDHFPDYGPAIWVAGGTHGVYILTLRDLVEHQFPRDPQEPYSHNGTRVNVFHRDTSSGIIWLGTEGGLEKYDPNDLRCSRIFLPLSDKMSQFMSFSGVVRDPADPDRYWISVWASGLYEWRRSTNRFRYFGQSTGLRNNELFDVICTRDGRLWVGEAGGVEEIDPRTGRPVRFFGPAFLKTPKINHKILALEEGADGAIWIGANYEGLFRLDPLNGRTKPVELPGLLDRSTTRRINRLKKDKQGRLYIATADGVYRCRPSATIAELLWRRPEAQLSCSDIAFDSLGRVWLASVSGALCLDENGRLVDSLTAADGLPDRNVHFLTVDRGGDLWIGTGSGLYRFDPASRTIRNRFDKKDGLLGVAIENLLATLPGGEIFVGHTYGFNLFDPDYLPRNTLPPRVVLSGIRVLDEVRALDPSGILVLRPGENMVSFDFSVLNFTQPEKSTLRYRLSGFQEVWVHTLPGIPVSYTNLDGGEYVLQVRAFNGDGVASAVPYELRIKVIPPFYKTFWFRFLMAFLLGLLIALIFWYREREQRKLEAIRRRIARDLHDDMGSTLSSIRFFSEVAQNRLPTDDPGDTRPLLRRIADSAGTLSDAVRDIVWAIGGKNDQLDDLVTRMREFGLKICETKDIAFRIELPEELPERPLRPDQLRNFYLIFKEAVNNAAKYAGCSEIVLRIRARRRHLYLEIADNGAGFEPGQAAQGSGNGLPNLYQRAAEIGGKLTLDTAAGKGTRVILTAPL